MMSTQSTHLLARLVTACLSAQPLLVFLSQNCYWTCLLAQSVSVCPFAQLPD